MKCGIKKDRKHNKIHFLGWFKTKKEAVLEKLVKINILKNIDKIDVFKKSSNNVIITLKVSLEANVKNLISDYSKVAIIVSRDLSKYGRI